MTAVHHSSTTLDYAELRDALARAGAVVTAAELHGGVCGALCTGGASAAERWVADCLVDQDLPPSTEDVTSALRELVATSWRMLDDRELEFEPLLPSDEAPLDERVEALALWCHGFLGAVGLAGAIASDDIAEILGDFAEISRAGLGEDEAMGGEQPDFALAEIHEYVRVGVQLVFEELAERRAAPPPELH